MSGAAREASDRAGKEASSFPHGIRPWFAVFTFVVVLAALRVLIALEGQALTPQAIRALVSESGTNAPLLLIGLLVVRPFVFFPCAVLFAAAGIAFGGLWGAVYSCVGYLLGSAAGFGLARLVGRDFVERQFHIPFHKTKRKPWNASWVLLLNLIPVVPNGPVNLAAGLSRMGFWTFLGATLTGILPWAVLFSGFGDAAIGMDLQRLSAVTAAVLAAFLAVTLLYRKRYPHGPAWVSTRFKERD